ncbi:hypothetical protein [Kocuria sp. NPDC057446]|uniref:hypothetical protein n=1 Tax=Kocuria sp. NPDC057446 TaxID=3346137 RepID=UPI0036A2C269
MSDASWTLDARHTPTTGSTPFGADADPRADSSTCLLAPGQHETTRLLLKVVADISPRFAPALSIGDLVMAGRHPLSLKALDQNAPRPEER